MTNEEKLAEINATFHTKDDKRNMRITYSDLRNENDNDSSYDGIPSESGEEEFEEEYEEDQEESKVSSYKAKKSSHKKSVAPPSSHKTAAAVP